MVLLNFLKNPCHQLPPKPPPPFVRLFSSSAPVFRWRAAFTWLLPKRYVKFSLNWRLSQPPFTRNTWPVTLLVPAQCIVLKISVTVVLIVAFPLKMVCDRPASIPHIASLFTVPCHTEGAV